MHGRPRKAPTPADENALARKASKLRSLQTQFLQNHHSKIYTKEALEINSKLLEANPEYLTAWNYRKLAVEHYLNGSESEGTGLDSLRSILDEELRVVENALRKNYKSYGAWYHRKWVLRKGHSSIEQELRLLNMFQKQDARNFHAWNYRRFIAVLKNISDKEELQFTTDMINDNFSNYSAWHNRSMLLSRFLGDMPEKNFLTDEYDFVRNALFTDPDDQSGWFYHLWLLDQTVKTATPMLASSWPPHGSNLTVSMDPDASALSLLTEFEATKGEFPLILYFSESVEGLNSSTVTIEFEFNGNIRYGWRPLSVNKFGGAQAWVAHLKLPYDKLPSKPYPVRVSIGSSAGITSLNGVPYGSPSYVEFSVCIEPLLQCVEGQKLERTSRRDDNLSTTEISLEDSNLLNSFYRTNSSEGGRPTCSSWNMETIASEIAHYRELLSWMDCKIGKLTLARLLMAYDAMAFNNNLTAPIHSEEVLHLYQELMQLDVPHSKYYKDEYSLVFLKKATSNLKSLLGYCRQHRDPLCLSASDCICLQLSNLSLSRIGSVERLLWVKMLDLSNNQIRSIEGVEALQLLSYLNLSNNKLCSFTALDPLRMLQYLKVLDVSYNELGTRSIDTKRYLCASPLSQTVADDWNFAGFSISNPEAASYWEAYSVFRSLNLRKLDIEGNAVSDENFKRFLLKILPSLSWLDGEELL